MFGPLGAVFPACPRVENDALVEPLRGGGRAAGRCDDAGAVGEERDAKGGTRVEVLADEEVAVVEGGGAEGDNGLEGLLGGKEGGDGMGWEAYLVL